MIIIHSSRSQSLSLQWQICVGLAEMLVHLCHHNSRQILGSDEKSASYTAVAM